MSLLQLRGPPPQALLGLEGLARMLQDGPRRLHAAALLHLLCIRHPRPLPVHVFNP